MLLTLLLKFVNVLLGALLALFPNWEPPQNTPAWTALSAANIVLPLDTWAMLSGATIAVMGAGLAVWGAKLVANFVRGSGA